MAMRTAFLALALLCAGVAEDAVAQEGGGAAAAVQVVAGTPISLRPFPDYAPAENFSGFASEATGGSIVVVSLPKQAFAEMAPDDDVDRLRPLFEQSGVIVEDAEAREIGGRPGLLIRGRQPANQLLYRKWVALIDAEETYIVTVQVPEAHAPDDAAISDLFASLTIGVMPSLADQVEALPFAIGAIEPFRIVRVTAGNMLLLTVGESDVAMPGQPSMIVGTSIGNVPPVDTQASYAEQRIRNYPGFAVREILSRVDNEDGGEREVEIIAAADDTESGEDVRIAQWIRFSDSGYLMVVGFAPAASWEAVLPQMRAVRAGVIVK